MMMDSRLSNIFLEITKLILYQQDMADFNAQIIGIKKTSALIVGCCCFFFFYACLFFFGLWIKHFWHYKLTVEKLVDFINERRGCVFLSKVVGEDGFLVRLFQVRSEAQTCKYI